MEILFEFYMKNIVKKLFEINYENYVKKGIFDFNNFALENIIRIQYTTGSKHVLNTFAAQIGKKKLQTKKL